MNLSDDSYIYIDHDDYFGTLDDIRIEEDDHDTFRTEQRRSFLLYDLTHHIENKSIPTYLVSMSELYEYTILDELSKANITYMEKLQQIAVHIHYSTIINLKAKIWSLFFKFGTGQFKPEKFNRKIWPPLLKSILQSTNKKDVTKALDITDERCLEIVHTRLEELERQQKYHEDKINENLTSLPDDQKFFEPILRTFIEKNLSSLFDEYEYTVALMTYQYEDRCYALEIQQHHVPHDQIELIEMLCLRKYEYEKSRQEINLFQQYLTEENFDNEFFSLKISPPSFIETIDDQSLRQSLVIRHENIVRDYKKEIILLFYAIAKAYKLEQENLFNSEIATFWQLQRSSPREKQLHSIVINLMEQRFTNISDKLQTMYRYKIGTLLTRLSFQ